MLSFVADCANCAGLCCVALPYQASADFRESKSADRPCRHLGAAGAPYACGIHDRLAHDGWRGCVAFDCAGAGPHTVHTTYGGRSWLDEPGGAATPYAAEQFAVFRVLVGVFEVGAYVAEACGLAAPGGRAADPGLAAELAGLAAVVAEVAARPPADLAGYDPAELRTRAGPALHRTAAAVRAAGAAAHPLSRQAMRLSRQAPGADLTGRDLRGTDLAAADLTGASLLGADLSGADLDGATLLGADLRGCRLTGTRLAGAVFVPRGYRP